jgi:hypothetical protein
MKALTWIVLLGSCWACTATSPESKVESEPARTKDPVWVEPPPAPTGIERDLGPLLGGKVIERAPTPGRWASAVRFSQHRFITMEFTIAKSISGSAVVRLVDDGSVTACFATRESSSSDMSHYQAHDGKDHHYASDNARVIGMTGTWNRTGTGEEIEIVFDRTVWRTCEVDPNTEVFTQPAVRCFGFAANAKVPGAALICEVPEILRWIADLALLIGDTPRAGPWAMRHDPSGHGDKPPADAPVWLLLGAEPGFQLSADDTDRDAKPLTIVRAEVRDPDPA